MKTILVPTDFSDNATNALQFAIDFAERKDAQILIVHAYQLIYNEVYLPFPSITGADFKEKEEAERQMDETKKMLKKSGFNRYSCVILEGIPFEVISTLVQEQSISTVIMGTKGHQGLSSALFGTNAVKVIERVNCAVIIVPSKAKVKQIKTITYATSYDESDIKALEKLNTIAKLFNSAIHVLHITDGELSYESEKKRLNAFKEKVLKEITDRKVTFQMLNGGSTEMALEVFIKENPCDMLSMCKHQRNLYDKIFRKSITAYMVYHSKTPLLIFQQDTLMN